MTASDLLIVELHGDQVVADSAAALAAVKGERLVNVMDLYNVKVTASDDVLSIVGHGSENFIDWKTMIPTGKEATVGGYPAAELADLLKKSKLNPKRIESISCFTGHEANTFAQKLANEMNVPVTACGYKVNVLDGIMGVPQARINGMLAPDGIGWRTVLPENYLQNAAAIRVAK